MAEKNKRREQELTEEQKTEKQEEKGGRASGRSFEFAKGVLFGVLLSGICVMTVFLVLNGTIGRGGSDGEESGASVLTSQETQRKMAQIQERIEDSFLYEVDGEELGAYLFKGVAVGLDDPYANYYTQEELQSIQESSQGAYHGIGITLLKDVGSGQLRVAGVYEGSPASEAGLQADDCLLKVGETDVTDMDLSSVVALIKDQEKMELTVLRGQEQLTLTVQAADVEIPTVSGQMLQGDIGYLKISEFASVTVEQFRETLDQLKDDGMKKLVADVRGNPGGNLDSVCDILDELLPEGLIVYTEDKAGSREEYTSDEQQRFDGPVAVLVNGNSASAAEIFAGAIQDYELGPVVGTTTYGKGVVQRTYLLDDGSALKLTTETYFTPNGREIEGTGIEPDVTVETGESEDGQDSAQTAETVDMGTVDLETDEQLRTAVELLEDM